MGIGHGNWRKWAQQRTNLEKTLISISLVLFLTCFLIIIFGIVLKGSNPEETVPNPICMSMKCVQTVGDMIKKIDFTADPCQDFYKYACGQFVRTNAIPLDHYEASVEHESSDALRIELKNWLEASTDSNAINSYSKARILYSTCMDFDVPVTMFASIVQKVITDEQIGNWPVLDPMWFETDVSLEQRLASLTLLGVPVAFELQIVPDSENPKKYITRISPGKPLLSMHETDRALENLRSYMESVLVLLGVSQHKASTEVNDILSMEAYFIRIKKRSEEECGNVKEDRNNDLLSVTVPLKELDRMMPYVNWTQIMQTVYSTINTTQEFSVELHCRRFIREYTDFLDQASPKTVYNYLGWRFLFSFISHLGQPFQKLRLDYEDAISLGQSERMSQPRWKDCVSLVERYMLPVVAAVYSQITENVLEQRSNIERNVKSSFESLISAGKFLDIKEKETIKQKVSKVKFEDVLSIVSGSGDRENTLFSKLNLHHDHLLHNILRIQRFLMTEQLRKLTSPPQDDMGWGNLSLTSPGHLQYYGNVIAVPYDKTGEPYLRPLQPSYLNYGGYATFIAQQLIHYTARLSVPALGKNYNVLNMIESKGNISSCFKKQNGHKRSIDSSDGQTALEHVWADLGSIQVSHKSYTRHRGAENKLPGMDLNQEQLFFMSYAQAFCEVRDDRSFRYVIRKMLPSRIRINSALRNFPKFSEVFGCRNDVPMNPTEKCHLW